MTSSLHSTSSQPLTAPHEGLATAMLTARPAERERNRNPFARPKANTSNSFSRESLLPTLSPIKPINFSPVKSGTFHGHGETLRDVDPNATPAVKTSLIHIHGTSSASKEKRQGWRLLWRGGLEVGRDGWRLDGITFFALLSFPSTPSQSTSNPFDAPITTPGSNPAASPFPSLPSADTDLCLSLESMRGRKYLQVRGVIDLPEDEVLEGEGSEDGGVQLSISPHAPLLGAYMTSLLCRNPRLSPSGRTLNALIIGLGDEGVEASHNSTLLIYGQRQLSPSPDDPSLSIPTLRLCVGRRKPPPVPASAKKIRPGDPLPRPPLFFPVKSNKSLSLISRRSKPLSRTSSKSSVYLPPTASTSESMITVPNMKTHEQTSSHSYISNASLEVAFAKSRTAGPMPASGRTPGRRGEKRKRPDGEGEGSHAADQKDLDERRRRSGKIVPSRSLISSNHSGHDTNHEGSRSAESEQEDIFGSRPDRVTAVPDEHVKLARHSSERLSANPDDVQQAMRTSDAAGDEMQETSGGRSKRIRVPQQILDNKATIRKQALVLLEARGYQRHHEIFKDVFSMCTKGTYLVFRDALESGPLPKFDIQRIVNGHLDMYLPASSGTNDTAHDPVMAIKTEADSDTDTPVEEEQSGTEGDVNGQDLRRLFSSGHSVSRGSTILEGIVEEEDE